MSFMDHNSRLIPSRIVEQSLAAISKLQTDNERLRVSITAIDRFINDNTNHTRGLRNLRSKMDDYRTATNAMILANDADIHDHQKLRLLAGSINVNLNGLTIIRNRDCRLTAIHNLEGQIAHYRGIRFSWWEHLFLGTWVAEQAMANNSKIREYERLLGLAQEALARWEAKEQQYNDFETATKELFTEGSALRAAAERGISYITGASGFPNSYHSDGLASWRSDIQVKKDDVIGCIIERLVIRDEAGNIIDYNWDEIEALLGHIPIDLDDLNRRDDWESLAQIIAELMPPLTVTQERSLAYVFGSMSEPRDIERFLDLMAIPLTDENGVAVAFSFHNDRMARILEAGNIFLFDDIFDDGPRMSDEQRHQMMQNMGVLTVMTSFSGILPVENRNTADARPSFSINCDAPHLSVNIEHSNMVIIPELPWFNNLFLGFAGWESQEFTVTSVRHGRDADDPTLSLRSIIYEMEFERITSIDVSGKGFWYGISSNIFKTVVGAIKIKKWPLGKAYQLVDSILGYSLDDPNLARLRSEQFAQFVTGNVSSHAEQFNLEAVVIHSNNERPTVIFHPTQETENMINRINDELPYVDIDAIVAEFNSSAGSDIVFDGELNLAHVLNFPAFSYHLFRRTVGASANLDTGAQSV